MISIKKTLSALASHICIEQGTYGIWTYKKYADGTAECWGSIFWDTGAFVAWGTDFYSPNYSPRADFPFTFIEVPVTIATSGGNGAGDYWIVADYGNKTTTSQLGRYYAARPGSSPSIRAGISVFVIGKWK